MTNKSIWTTKDGRELLISEMETPHIERTISMLQRKGLDKEKLLALVRIEGEIHDLNDPYYVPNYKEVDNPYCYKFFNLKEELKRRGRAD